MPSNHLIICHPLLLLPQSLPASRSFPMSQLFAWGGQSIGFSFSISPSKKHPGQISIRMDWLDLFTVQGTLKSLLQHHSWKASIFGKSAFFILQLSHPYMITGKTIALTRWTFVGKVMSLLFNMLSRLVVAFLPRSMCLNFMAAVTVNNDFGAQENEVCQCFHFFPYIFAMKWRDWMPWFSVYFLVVRVLTCVQGQCISGKWPRDIQ